METFWWDLRDRDCAGDVSIAFCRDGAERRVGARVCSDSLDTGDIAAAVHTALDLDEVAGDDIGVQVWLIRGGTSIPVASPPLARIGGALFRRASLIA